MRFPAMAAIEYLCSCILVVFVCYIRKIISVQSKNLYKYIFIVILSMNMTAFTRCRLILKTVKNVMDRPPVHAKMAHIWPTDFENGNF